MKALLDLTETGRGRAGAAPVGNTRLLYRQLYRVTILVGKSLPLTWTWDVLPSYLGRR